MRENPLCTRREGKTLNKRRKRDREAEREGGRERDVGYGTYQIDMFGSSYGTPELQAAGGSCTIQ